MKFFPAIILLVCTNLFPQETDTTFTDTSIVITDSSFIIQDSLSYDTSLVSLEDSVVHVDTLYPILQKPFYNGSFFINREIIEQLDYRYTGDLFIPAAFSFLKDKGMAGQPNEFIIYGNGFGRTGFFSDGILYNNRLTGFLDLNLMQNELIDSIEVLPLPRGFLYGTDNYPASVNFIEKDFITPAPYTRIKYYEGPEGEAFVDGIFNTSFFNKFNLFFDITNRNFDGIYKNSDFSIWQANFKLKYFLSNSINLTGTYSLVSSDLGYFGGVDVDSISQFTNDINAFLYDPSQAPVVYPNLRQEVSWDKFKIRGLGKFGDFKTDLNFYYHAAQEKYSGIPSNDEMKNYITGTSIRQSYSSSIFKLELNGAYENRELNYYYLFYNNQDSTSHFRSLYTEYNIFSASPVLSLYFFDSTLIPSFFFKVSDYQKHSENGIGSDIVIRVSDMLKFYLGISLLNYRNNYGTDLYEISASLNFYKLSADIRFYRQKDEYPISFGIYPTDLPIYYPTRTSGKLNGISANVSFNFWKILLEESFNYNSYEESQGELVSQIKMHLHSGLYYKDILFNNNLDLKTGFVIKYYDFESEDIKSASQVDFTLAGIIQKVAIVYFSWENLFDEDYFLVPYYPMRERGLRFGLAWELFN